MRIKNYLKGYKLYFTSQAKRDLKKFEKKDVKQILDKLDDLIEGKENLDITPLEGSKEPIYRLRTGDYRIIYKVENHIITVSIIEIGHRREIYRKR